MSFDNVQSFGSQAFTVLMLLISLIVSSHLCYGYGTKSAKEAFILMTLLLLMGTQTFYLIHAATFIPATRFYVYNDDLFRTDCLESGKGGKRPGESTLDIDLNPCFCDSRVYTCIDKQSGKVVNGTCPIDDSAECVDTNDKQISIYLSRKRNCLGGQGRLCTKDQPCFPCERSTLEDFNGGRCRSCSTDFTGNCHFVKGIGPYCFESKDSKNVVPCKRCCTDPEPLISGGKCY